MNVQKWVSFFTKTLLIGALVYFFAGLFTQWHHLSESIHKGTYLGALIQVFVLMVFGGMFSVLSQMGFFAYLTLHRIALGMFGSHSLWANVQWLLIAFAVFDLVYFRHLAFAKNGESIVSDLLLPVILLVIALVTAYYKKRATNSYAFVPTIFFMFVITTIEWLVGLFQKDFSLVCVIGLTLIACNAYQILTLHKLTVPREN
ncbi:KinB-signaling pathway activation protein [Pullulanibacillus sp. KACC 23026]|uniref:KinB-signaling pathway activation protein n=1 Tax=Pullulanibacillus sp. KACC 23026 TaxID=3028315 RepID=UPI0023AF3458|nr:KinB-signaling pathway activation protein [Pullulanibacillus sp. KACC 23026]WEG12622.1 KinB-signaling pathway activation protein [Pullulanibacillus sp. KACC 23026]